VGFWTILFAVAGGVLLADVVRLLVAAVLAHAALSAASEALRSRTTPGHLPARPDLVEVRPATDARPRLPGPVAARASASSWACISGYVAERNGAGWSQRTPLEACTAESE
jgi:hypothetical protein